MPDGDETYPVLCVRVKDVPAGTVLLPGTAVVRCTGCRARVYAAPSTVRHVAEGLLRPVCRACVPPDRNAAAMTGAQAQELRSWLGQSPEAN